MTFEPDGAALRREHDLERLGTRNPRCAVCPEEDPAALTGTFPDILCAEHRALSQGRSPVEDQHPSGQHNDPDTTLPTPLNNHVIWDAAKADWPEETFRNLDRSPLLAASASVRSVLDWFRLIIERVLGWIPPVLETLDARLVDLFGRRWWEGPGFEGVMR